MDRHHLLFGSWLALFAVAVQYNGGLHSDLLFALWVVGLAVATLAIDGWSWPGFADAPVRGARIRQVAAGCIGLFAASLVLSIWISPAPGLASEQGFATGMLVLGYFLARSCAATGFRESAIWDALRCVGWVLAVFAISERVLTGQRAYTVFADPNALSALFNLLIVCELGALLGRTTAERPPGSRWLGLLVFAAGDGATGSLSGIICLVFAIVLLIALVPLALLRERWRWASLLIVSLMATTLLVGATGRGEHPTEKLAGISHHSSFTVRLEMIKSSLAIYRDHGHGMGSGLGSYKVYYPQYRNVLDSGTTGDLAHNDYVQFLQEGGPLLAGSLVALALLSMGLTLRSRRAAASDALSLEGLAVGAAAAGLLLHAAMNFIFYVAPLCLAFGVMLARQVECVTPSEDRPPAAPHRRLLQPVLLVVAAVLIAGTLGARGLFILVSQPGCEWRACLYAKGTPRVMERITAFVAGTQPTWLPVREYLIRNALDAVGADDGTARQRAAASHALREIAGLVHDAPQVSNAYIWLAELLQKAPGLSTQLPANLPHDIVGLYSLALARDPYVLGLYIESADILHKGNRTQDAFNLMQKPLQLWNYQFWGDSGRLQILLTTIPLAIELHRCEDAREMGTGLKSFIDMQRDAASKNEHLAMPAGAPPFASIDLSEAMIRSIDDCVPASPGGP